MQCRQCGLATQRFDVRADETVRVGGGEFDIVITANQIKHVGQTSQDMRSENAGDRETLF